MSKKMILTGFSTGTSATGALTLFLKDQDGKTTEVIILPSMAKTVIDMIVTGQARTPEHIDLAKVRPTRPADRQLAERFLNADKRPDGWYALASMPNVKAAFLLLRDEGRTVQLGLEADDIRTLIRHLENALAVLDGAPPIH